MVRVIGKEIHRLEGDFQLPKTALVKEEELQ
jgi:hypothetical protein